MWRKSRDFFDLYDVEVEGIDHPAQGFFDFVGDPADAMGEDFQRMGLRIAAVFDRACDGDCVGAFLFHAINLSEMR